MSDNFQNIDQLNLGKLLQPKQGKGVSSQLAKNKHKKDCKCLTCKMKRNKTTEE